MCVRACVPFLIDLPPSLGPHNQGPPFDFGDSSVNLPPPPTQNHHSMCSTRLIVELEENQQLP